MNDHRRRDVTIQNRPAFAAVSPSSERLGFDRPACRAGLRGAARIDQLHLSTGTSGRLPVPNFVVLRGDRRTGTFDLGLSPSPFLHLPSTLKLNRYDRPLSLNEQERQHGEQRRRSLARAQAQTTNLLVPLSDRIGRRNRAAKHPLREKQRFHIRVSKADLKIISVAPSLFGLKNIDAALAIKETSKVREFWDRCVNIHGSPLMAIAETEFSTSTRFDALLQACVVKTAEVAQHFRQRRLLGTVWLDAEFV